MGFILYPYPDGSQMPNPITQEELTFRDTKDNLWDLKLNLYIAERVDASDFSAVSQTEFSFLSPEKEFFQEVYTNTSLAMALVWAIVQDQVDDNLIKPLADKADVSLEEFKENSLDSTIDLELEFIKCIDGDVLQAAKTSLLRALADFFPQHRIVLLQFLNQLEKMIALTDLQMSTVLPEVAEHMEKEFQEACQQLKRDMVEGKPMSDLLGENSTEPSLPSLGDEIKLPT